VWSLKQVTNRLCSVVTKTGDKSSRQCGFSRKISFKSILTLI